MITLEKLYETASNCLTEDEQKWAEFANDFQDVFNAGMALYSPGMNNPEMDIQTADEIIATTNPEMVTQYFDEKIYELEETIDDPENPFEPIRRTDSMSNEAFLAQEITQKFMLPNGVFYKMVVFGVLADGSFLILFVWRDEATGDFSDLEKQRLALFMRYLTTFVRANGQAIVGSAENDVKDFGQKHGLTESETAILANLLQGNSLRAIASQTDRTYETVRWHVKNILEKCQVKTQQNLLSEFYRLIKR